MKLIKNDTETQIPNTVHSPSVKIESDCIKGAQNYSPREC